MDRDHLVRDVILELDSQTHTASYFIEDGMIYASIDDITYRVPVGDDPADDTVRSILSERLRGRNFRAEMTTKWAARL